MSKAEKEIKRFGRRIDSEVRRGGRKFESGVKYAAKDAGYKFEQNLRGVGHAVDDVMRAGKVYDAFKRGVRKVVPMPTAAEKRLAKTESEKAEREMNKRHQRSLLELAELEDERARIAALANRSAGRSLLVSTSPQGVRRTLG